MWDDNKPVDDGYISICPRGGGDTSLYETNRDVPLDGVAFSRLD